MFLLTPHQFNQLNPTGVTTPHSKETMRRTAEDVLDEKMRAVLNETGITPYEKIRKYNALLQRYLNLLKQAGQEERHNTLTLPEDTGLQKGEENKGIPTDGIKNEVLQNLPKRYRKNAEYIMNKLVQSSGGWNETGEFIDKGIAVKGSHMMDLLKNLSWSYKNTEEPKGWTVFLNTLRGLNVPSTIFHNRQAREQYSLLKTGELRGEPKTKRRRKSGGKDQEEEESKLDPPPTVVKKRSRRAVQLNPRWLNYSV